MPTFPEKPFCGTPFKRDSNGQQVVPGDQFKPVQHKIMDDRPTWHPSDKQLGDILTPTDKER